jgi:hypothetical protein
MKIDPDQQDKLPALWEAVDSLIPGALITQDEADDYVAGTLSPERLSIVQSLLEKTPTLRDQLQSLRARLQAEIAAQSDLAMPTSASVERLDGLLKEAMTKIIAFPQAVKQWMYSELALVPLGYSGVEYSDYDTKTENPNLPAALRIELTKERSQVFITVTAPKSLDVLLGRVFVLERNNEELGRATFRESPGGVVAMMRIPRFSFVAGESVEMSIEEVP